jgi:hypothetical protein
MSLKKQEKFWWEEENAMAYELPQFKIENKATVSRNFLQIGIKDFHSAIQYVWDLPYGRNSNSSDYSLVLAEKKGTCSSKHAILAKLAQEHYKDIHLVTGIYEMCEQNTHGVGKVLEKYALSYLPEAHCYLTYKGRRFDYTRNLESINQPIDSFLYEETILPDQIGEYKRKLHQAFLQEWLRDTKMDSITCWEALWGVREECIQALEEG